MPFDSKAAEDIFPPRKDKSCEQCGEPTGAGFEFDGKWYCPSCGERHRREAHRKILECVEKAGKGQCLDCTLRECAEDKAFCECPCHRTQFGMPVYKEGQPVTGSSNVNIVIQGAIVENEEYVRNDLIPALRDLVEGDTVTLHGTPIGQALSPATPMPTAYEAALKRVEGMEYDPSRCEFRDKDRIVREEDLRPGFPKPPPVKVPVPPKREGPEPICKQRGCSNPAPRWGNRCPTHEGTELDVKPGFERRPGESPMQYFVRCTAVGTGRVASRWHWAFIALLVILFIASCLYVCPT